MALEESGRTVTSGHSYEAARRRRAELLGTIHDFERAVAALGAEPGWRRWVGERLASLRDQLTEHIVVTEGPDGLYAELCEHAPRLARPVEALVAEHDQLLARTGALVGSVPDPNLEVSQLRERAGELLGALSRHRQRGADLVYEAYATDIGGET